MPTYAFAHLQTVDFNAEIVEYIERIDATLEPFEGRFLIHGEAPTVVDGSFEGMLVAIEFPDRERATAWYESDAYQQILPLRTRNATGGAFIVDGVAPGYRAASFVARSKA
ncbi:DUF1330 domain-containing protein [Conexibacter arvalis]|uniref:Uncharacterized protein (DUF1330 family) n=1 Tax=Conexibacter arvalis TaxID=912552 RepID=A0A840IEW2_9ACTN|nr:DUF1330 domain-containing protein [Conexibacter arvalis]MBB4662855.1 uncharacterized protein (DUF1330 family) [Conexibacter arvalis]